MLIKNIIATNGKFVTQCQSLEFVPLLLLRLYLAPVFIQAGWTKFTHFESTVNWFGNAEWGLGMPFPEVAAVLAALIEFAGGWLLLVGLFTRLISIPLAITMLVAAITAHWQNGWLAIADSNSWFADGTIFLNESIMAAAAKKEAAISILKEYGNYDWLTSSGYFTILNNGIEFAVTYFIMTLVLVVYGGGRFFSADYYLSKYFTETHN